MKKWKAIIPFVPDMGSIIPLVVGEYPSKQAEALWHLNSMRDHDGLPHLNRLPAGVKFERVPYQPKTGEKCSCRPGVARDNCPTCEGTGWRIDFKAIRER